MSLKKTNDMKFRILVVDDEQSILDSYKTVLAGTHEVDDSIDEAQQLATSLFGDTQGDQSSADLPVFDLVQCRQGDEAVEAVRTAIEYGNRFAVVFLDIRMPPGPDGVWTAQQIRQLDADIQIVIVTGYSDINPLEIAKRVGPPDKLLYTQKPFHRHELLQFAFALSAKWFAEKQLRGSFNEITEIVYDRTKELEKANAQLREHEQLKDEFVINVSHELRTPLTIFSNIVSNLLAGVSGPVNSQQRKDLETANKEIARLGRIIGDFLDITRIDAGKMDLKLKPVAIQSLVEDAVNLFRPLAQNKNVEITALLPDKELVINCDGDMISRTINNLIDNAVKFSPGSEGKVIVRVKDLGDEVGVDVEDNGMGIISDDIGKVFNRFVQIERKAGPGMQGTGLGLAISKELVEMHGGRIWGEHTPTGGANFCFVLPKLCKKGEEFVQNSLSCDVR